MELTTALQHPGRTNVSVVIAAIPHMPPLKNWTFFKIAVLVTSAWARCPGNKPWLASRQQAPHSGAVITVQTNSGWGTPPRGRMCGLQARAPASRNLATSAWQHLVCPQEPGRGGGLPTGEAGVGWVEQSEPGGGAGTPRCTSNSEERNNGDRHLLSEEPVSRGSGQRSRRPCSHRRVKPHGASGQRSAGPADHNGHLAAPRTASGPGPPRNPLWATSPSWHCRGWGWHGQQPPSQMGSRDQAPARPPCF